LSRKSGDDHLKPFDVLALGEVLLRLSPPVNERLTRGNLFEKKVGGAELNVMSGISLLGLRTGIISRLPANDIGTYAKNKIRYYGVSDDYLIYDYGDGARIGIYFYENGASPRKPRVVYDRKYTSMDGINCAEFPEKLYDATRCFHTSGITLAISKETRMCAFEMIKKFKSSGALISFDVNFRANLWTGKEAKECIEEILPFVDIFFCSEETARLTFGKEGDLYSIMREFTDEYPIRIVASTKRIVHSPKIHSFNSVIYDKKKDCYYAEKPYENIDVIDRIGSGDAYVAGALYGLLSEKGSCEKALMYGNAYSALKDTVPGDLPTSDLKEVQNTIAAHQSNDAQPEMER
jgi:2-dehydro-3-deoxygluconokinase